MKMNKDDNSVQILVEIVSAMDLTPPNFDHEKTPDAYVIMRYAGFDSDSHIIHKTKPVRKDFNPIWTIQTGSLYLFQTDKDTFDACGGLIFKVFTSNMNPLHKPFCHGLTSVSWEDISERDGQRLEFPLVTRKRTNRRYPSLLLTKMGKLVLRFRHATDEDIKFMVQYQPGVRPNLKHNTSKVLSTRRLFHDGGPSDFNFKKENPQFNRRLIRRMQKANEGLYMVKPFPDPENQKETEWLTKEQINSLCLEPSRKWYTAGSGSKGIVRVEVMSCDNLPDLDLNIDNSDLTDAFVALAFEDVLVRTDVIHDELSPRWMPWCNRAFQFNINHPSNLLFIGVFDFDFNIGPLTEFDPVGRVVIDLSNFKSNTVYIVSYKLHLDQNHTSDRGTIKLRIKVDWKNEREALLESFTKSPICYINVDNRQAYHVLKYLCKGEVNLEKASIKSIKLYANELSSYYGVLLLIIDQLISIFLWRNRLTVSFRRPNWILQDVRPEIKLRELVKEKISSTEKYLRFSFWFPIHSIFLFKASITVVENPYYLPGVTFLAMSWIMLSIGFATSHSPSPWVRCKTISEITSVLIFGQQLPLPVKINENDGVDTTREIDKLTEARKERIDAFLRGCKEALTTFQKKYFKTNFRESLETEEKNFWLYEKSLYYVHIFLRQYCLNLRVVKNIVTWRSSSKAYVTTIACFILGVLLIVLPWGKVIFWICRIAVWGLFGPWMKLFDIYFIMPNYKTILEASEEDIKEPFNVERLFQTPEMMKLAQIARIASEDALKLKTMRQYLYGKYSVVVPDYDSSRFPSIPLPDSTARTFKERTKTKTYQYLSDVEEHHIPGQRLRGRMIHTRHHDFRDGDDHERPEDKTYHSTLHKLKTFLHL